mgnify:CR=1 FL=1
MEITNDIQLKGTAWNKAISDLGDIFATRTHYSLFMLSLSMNENYKHPERIRKQEKQDRKKKKRDDFWETYGTMEILDDILGDHKKS